ncbi:MAG: hypothetical protein CMH63_02940 [Nanoarchaeota archaeon]|jgi:ribosomal protein S24E|nr:hypothetical protein [Nanoarchaeota archaeon]|tara:strand:- start:9618 stop:9980 length:363 start_codon:yes stop_codon:yes gene_type:complete
MKKLKETPSPLINRTRVEYEIEHFQKSTPKKDDLKAQLAKELKTQEDTIHVKHIFSHFGSSKSKIIADIYKTKEDLKKYVKIKKKKVAEGEQPAAPAQPVEKKEVAPKEEKKEAPKEEKK